MSGKSLNTKHANRVARAKIAKISIMRGLTKDDQDIIPAQINMAEQICQSCGFKARYKFVRCPECNEVQKG